MSTFKYTDKGMVELADGGVAWSGSITLGNILVCNVSNDGQGGCDDYDIKHSILFRSFEITAQNEFPGEFEATDAYVAQLWEETLVAN